MEIYVNIIKTLPILFLNIQSMFSILSPNISFIKNRIIKAVLIHTFEQTFVQWHVHILYLFSKTASVLKLLHETFTLMQSGKHSYFYSLCI